MEDIIRQLLTGKSLAAPLIAIAITLLTGLVKRPVKALAKKMKDGDKLTRFITFLPVLLGFALTAAVRLALGDFRIDGDFVSLWLTGSSLSLAIYAYKEKFFPSKNKLLKEDEIEENLRLIDSIHSLSNKRDETEARAATATKAGMKTAQSCAADRASNSCPADFGTETTCAANAAARSSGRHNAAEETVQGFAGTERNEATRPCVKIVLKGGRHADIEEK